MTGTAESSIHGVIIGTPLSLGENPEPDSVAKSAITPVIQTIQHTSSGHSHPNVLASALLHRVHSPHRSQDRGKCPTLPVTS